MRTNRAVLHDTFMHDMCQGCPPRLARCRTMRDDETLIGSTLAAVFLRPADLKAKPHVFGPVFAFGFTGRRIYGQRVMFGFGNNHRDPLTDIRSAERWLASFPENDPLAMHAALVAELGLIADQATRRTPARLETLFFADSRVDGLRKTL